MSAPYESSAHRRLPLAWRPVRPPRVWGYGERHHPSPSTGVRAGGDPWELKCESEGGGTPAWTAPTARTGSELSATQRTSSLQETQTLSIHMRAGRASSRAPVQGEWTPDVGAEVPCWPPRCDGLRDQVTIAKHFLLCQGRPSPRESWHRGARCPRCARPRQETGQGPPVSQCPFGHSWFRAGPPSWPSSHSPRQEPLCCSLPGCVQLLLSFPPFHLDFLVVFSHVHGAVADSSEKGS